MTAASLVTSRHRRAPLAVLALGSLAALAGCAAGSAAAPQGESDGYPVTVRNCDVDVQVERAPERVVLLETAPVTILDELGVLDTVVARAGVFSPEYYDDDLMTKIEAIPTLTDDIDASGHLMISQEAVIAQQPDLVLALPEGLTREGLADAGANVLLQPVYCPGGAGDASFETLYEQITDYGTVFGREDRAAEVVAGLRGRVDAVTESAPGHGRTAAVLYPSVGGGPLYAYGRGSMAEPQLAAAGFVNVFSDVPDRVFEVGVEELVARDPDVLVLLYQAEPEGVVEEVTSLPGAETITAVRDGEMLPQLFNFTEPASPLNVTGLEHLADRFGGAGS